MTRPGLWKYILAGVLFIPVATAILISINGIDDIFMRYEQGRLGITGWLAVPLALLLALFGWRWMSIDRAERVAYLEATKAAETKRVVEAKAIESREFALEVLLLGMSVDKLRQHNLWQAVQALDPFTMIRSSKPDDYPWSSDEKSSNEGKRLQDALEHGVAWAPSHWAIPSFMASGPVTKPRLIKDGKVIVTVGIGSWQTAGLHWTMFSPTGRRFSENTESLLADVFNFFETNPDVPFVLVFANEGDGSRDGGEPVKNPKRVKDGHYVPHYTDTDVCLILARRDRAEWLRRFAVEDDAMEKAFLGRYIQADNAKSAATESDEWLAILRDWAATEPWKKSPKAAKMAEFKPTPWFAQPWTSTQFIWWDRLPLLGYVHRPQFVSFKTPEGKPMRPEERARAFNAAWKSALETLPDQAKPERVFYATGPDSARVTLLSGAMREIGPERELFNNKETIDFDKKMGDTGAATFFAQIGLGVIASYKDGGATAAVNLRDPEGASIVMVRPPPLENRKPHPAGGDVFRYGVTK